LAGILVLPVAIFFALRVEPFSARTLDPFIYVGYSQNLHDLVRRYGFPYYSVRLGLLLPSELAFRWLGPVGGLFLLRYLLAAGSAGVLYLLARRNGCRAAGWFGAIIFLSSPILLGALMTEYADTTGLPLLLIGVCCLLMPTSRRLWWALGGGMALGLAIHSSLFIAPLLLVVITARFALQLLRRDLAAVSTYLVMAAGIAFVTLLGALYYWRVLGEGNILGPSITWLRSSSGAASRSFRAPTHAWLGFSLYLYVPLIVAVAIVATLLTRPVNDSGSRLASMLQSPAADALVVLLAAEAFYFFHEFILKGYSLEYYFYASYLYAFSTIGMTLVVVELAGRRGVGTRLPWLACAVAIGLPLARNTFFHDLAFWAWPAVPLMVAVTAIPLVWSGRRSELSHAGTVALVASVVLLGLCPQRNVPMSRYQTVRADPHYELAIGNTSRVGLDWFELASQLIKVTPKWTSDPGTVLFWYPSDANVLNLMQATYIWLPDTLQYGDRGLPYLNAGQIAELRGRTPRTIILLAVTPNQIDTGRRLLVTSGLQPFKVVDERLHAGSTTVYTERLTFHAAPCDQQWRTIYVAWRSLPPTC
jgi:hypothetical protein